MVSKILLEQSFFIFRLANIFAKCRAPQLANTQASCSKQAAQAKPKGLLRLLCAGDAKNANQPGFSVEPKLLNALPSIEK